MLLPREQLLITGRLTQAVTPLLRRMVTNERQRLYALETRQEKRKAGEKINNKRKRDQNATSESEEPPGRKRGRQGNSPSPYDDVDPKLDEYHYHVEETYPEEVENGISESRTAQAVGNPFSIEEPDESNLRYHLSVIQNGQRIKPRLTLSPSSCPGFASLVQYIHTLLDDIGQKPSSVSILTAHGLVEVNSEESWEEAVTSILGNEWMDREVRCVVALENES
jgi:hypothetical protein